MVRTKADATRKAGGKAPRKAPTLRDTPYQSPKNGAKGAKGTAGNPYCPRPTPEWQQPISSFFKKDSEVDVATTLAELEQLAGENKMINLKSIGKPQPSASLGADPNAYSEGEKQQPSASLGADPNPDSEGEKQECSVGADPNASTGVDIEASTIDSILEPVVSENDGVKPEGADASGTGKDIHDLTTEEGESSLEEDDIYSADEEGCSMAEEGEEESLEGGLLDEESGSEASTVKLDEEESE